MSLTSAGLKLKLVLSDIFEHPLKFIIVLFLNTIGKLLEYFIIALNEWTLNVVEE